MNRITAIEKSLSVFACGIVGFFPVIGFVSAVCAIMRWRQVRNNFQGWNPAAGYLQYGLVLAQVGLLNSLIAAVVIGMAMVHP